MMMRRRGGRIAATMIGTSALLVATACSGDGGGSDGEITLVVETFGNFGYEQLIEQYMEDNPNVTVEERVHNELADWNETLTQNLAAGSGLGDVVAIEEGILADMYAASDSFHDLAEYGADEVEGEYLPWKWEMGLTPDGQILGLGTDIGGMALCYRVDHFEDAGLPTEPAEVSEQWETWEDFIDVGVQYNEADLDAAFVDTVTEYVNAISRQGGDDIFVDENGELIMEDSEAVSYSWDIAEQLIEEDLTAGLEMWSDDWTAAIQAGSFATMPCPAWMLGQIEENAGPDGEGMWNVAEVPGDGGNWGGSWLGVPTHTEHPEEAAELAMYLTSEESMIAAFEEANTLPSKPAALESEEVQAMTNPYFNDAPVGEIFAAGAMALQPVYLGPGHFPVQDASGSQLEAWQNGQVDRDEAWSNALEEAERAVG